MTIRCDQCEALMIRGVFCHERGCININKTWDSKSEMWIDPEPDTFTCPECLSEWDNAEDAATCCSIPEHFL